MVVTLKTILHTSSDIAWSYALKTNTLQYIAWPFIRFAPVEAPFPEEWSAGEYPVNIRAFGLIPLGKQIIRIEFPKASSDTKILRDNGYGKSGCMRLVAKWDHWIFIQTGEDNNTIYTDRIEIKAGWLTAFIWMYAQAFYRWRQYRWKYRIKIKTPPEP